jgi:hypothetical protein
VVFKYANENESFISFANTERIKYKQEWREGEKAGKVSLLRDISIEKPHRGHEDIINTLRITTSGKKAIRSFDALYNYWQEVFSVNILNKKFYQELSNWYFWAIKNVTFPSEPTLEDVIKKYGKADHDKLAELINEHNATNVIRLLTRLLFTWFIKEKKLIPESLFDLDVLQNDILKEINPYQQEGMFKHASTDSIYYKAILQNLFFASLNCPIEADAVDKRKRGFRGDGYGTHRGIDYLMRYKKQFKNPDAFLDLMNNTVPFLNGGLFECLDDKYQNIYIDGFSDQMTKGQQLIVPDFLFFGLDTEVDLSQDYGSKNKKYKKAAVKGLINILKSYKFTITENTPIEEDVALDPELLGKVFENLLASYNPETKSTARKQTGSFYTPREIVNYMVDESLIAYLKTRILAEDENVFVEIGSIQTNLFGNEDKSGQLTFQVNPTASEFKDNEEVLDLLLHQLVSYDPGNPFDGYPKTTKRILYHLDKCKILDPACGSGAFPMGILQKMVHILQKLDPTNEHWKDVQLEKAIQASKDAYDIEDKQERENKLIEINNAFDGNINDPDYARKLYLIENCIYGVDIQPIATQISKLRFFISLVVDQKKNNQAENFGIRALPNLETKFVTANTLIGIEKPSAQTSLYDTDSIKELERELKSIRHKLFGAKSKETKLKYRKKDEELRNAISAELKKSGWHNETADKLASWDPYDQNASASFFDSEWMFDVKEGFSVVIGNPPYVNFANLSFAERNQYKKTFTVTKNKTDLFAFFIEQGSKIINEAGVLSYIIPHTWKATDSFTPLRELIFKKFRFLKIVDLNFGVFDAIVKPVVILLKRQQGNTPINNSIKVYDENFQEVSLISNDEIESSSHFILDTLNTIEQKKVFKIIEANGITLNNIIEFSRGIKTSNDKRFIHKNNSLNSEYFPVFRGKNIKSFHLNWGGEYILYRPDLMKEKVGCVPHRKEFFSVPEKIVTQRVNSSMQLQAAYDAEQNYFLDTVNVSRFDTFQKNCSLKALCGILNSKVINFWYCLKYRMPTIGIYELHSIPIVVPNEKYDNLLSLFTQILSLKEVANRHLIKSVLDGIVFNLYFPSHLKSLDLTIMKLVEEDVRLLIESKKLYNLDDNELRDLAKYLIESWSHPDNEVRNRMKLFSVRSPDILKPILES